MAPVACDKTLDCAMLFNKNCSNNKNNIILNSNIINKDNNENTLGFKNDTDINDSNIKNKNIITVIIIILKLIFLKAIFKKMFLLVIIKIILLTVLVTTILLLTTKKTGLIGVKIND